jgi:hypothetical protein
MRSIPAGYRAHSAIVPVIDSFLRASANMSLTAELIEEEVIALLVGLDQS